MDRYVLERIYAGFLGKCFAVRLGAPLEPQIWTYEKIKEIYGEVSDYTKYYKTFAADDDTNGPLFFHRQLLDKRDFEDISSLDVARAWLNYGREGVGMFWWGGDGISTEHTAYNNLLRGVMPPESGGIKMNGKVLAEQIGGQIFIDTWGLLFPRNPKKAADHAQMAASVSHDGEGIQGARFMAACVALAFGMCDIKEIIKEALLQVDNASLYYKVVLTVIDFYEKNPEDWNACMEYLIKEWGYDKFAGMVHIIPNAGVCILALLYGRGSYEKTVEIATMCGWDTDCNAGNVGTILGVMNGLDDLPRKYRRVPNDRIVASSVIGQLNIIDIPTFAKETAYLSCKLNNIQIPDFLDSQVRIGKIDYDFALPGSTHGFTTDNFFKTEIFHIDNIVDLKQGALGILIDRMVEGDESHVYTKTYYRRDDFSDERYKPCFTPQAFSGQKVTFSLLFERWNGEEVTIIPYVRDTYTKEKKYMELHRLKEQKWEKISFHIPDLEGSFADEIGFKIITNSPLTNRLFGRINVTDFKVEGKPSYIIDFSKQSQEFGCITPFSFNRGKGELAGEEMVLTSEGACQAFTGSYYESDIDYCCNYTPLEGEYHKLIFKARGICQYYAVGFAGEDKVVIEERDFEKIVLEGVRYEWKKGETYLLHLKVEGKNLIFEINGEEILRESNIHGDYAGMYGIGLEGDGKGKIGKILINQRES